jgi:type IV secretory pathway VirB6-like protein
VVCIIGGAITAYFAPIFVPMSLFGVTKGFFDGWLKLLFAFALQPVVLIAFVVLMMTSFDQLIFTDCCWQKSADSAFWNLVPKGSRCMNSAGYLLFFTNNNSLSTMKSLTYPVFAPEIITPFFYIMIFCFVFYHMAQSIHEFAAELVGQPTIGGFQLRPMPHMGSIKKKEDKSNNPKHNAKITAKAEDNHIGKATITARSGDAPPSTFKATIAAGSEVGGAAPGAAARNIAQV